MSKEKMLKSLRVVKQECDICSDRIFERIGESATNAMIIATYTTALAVIGFEDKEQGDKAIYKIMEGAKDFVKFIRSGERNLEKIDYSDLH